MSEATEVAPGLRAQQHDGVHTWWLSNEARRNAVSPAALSWISQRCPELRGAVVVLRGAGGKAFCAGFDLNALAQPSAAGTLPDAPLIEATHAMREADATFVAVLDGYAIGAGVELACACDLRLGRHGIFFAIPAAELAVVYHAAGLANIRAVFGAAIVRRLVLLGERVSAEDALAAGALVRLVEPEALEDAVTDVLDRLRRAAPLSTRGNRDLLRSLERGTIADAARAEHEARRHAAYDSEDHREARLARAQGRAPRFRGR